jgi:predicted  nucleic acid-binding Zn-ribbon protein
VDINFESLINLQNLDEKIKEISLFLEQTPSHLKEIDEQINSGFQIVSEAKEKLADNQKKRRSLEADVQDIRALIARFRHQSNGVKSNKEYRAISKEIEEAEAKIEALEEEIISEMLAADEIESEIQKAEEKAKKYQEQLLKEKESFLNKSKEKKEERKNIATQKEKIIPEIPSQQVKLYLKIFDNNNGIALSPVTDDFCSMCQIRIRPQVLNELIARTKLILCENCGRILYYKKKSA